MPRHAYPPLDNLSPRLTAELKRRVGPDRGNVWKMLMWSPAMAEPFIDFNDAVRYKIALPDDLRELVILRVGNLCEAPYEVHHHTRIAREVGMSEELIRAAKTGSAAPGLDAMQKLLLDLTDELVKDRRASDATLAAAIKAFGPGGLTEVVMLVGCYVLACMFLRTFGIDIEQPATA
ncbi:MAG TPA: carboxymuconolactone decarboxylase family protein [Xanthobacteraceae bacterium]|nr:carboxymuconolactone decarboxylase family protein [Xanthobacteraceae bacterium]